MINHPNLKDINVKDDVSQNVVVKETSVDDDNVVLIRMVRQFYT